MIRRDGSGLRLLPRPGGAAGGRARSRDLGPPAALRWGLAAMLAAGAVAAAEVACAAAPAAAGTAPEAGPEGPPLPELPPLAPPPPSPLVEVVRGPLLPAGTAGAAGLRAAALPAPPPGPPPAVALDAPGAACRDEAEAGLAAGAPPPSPPAGVEVRPGGGYRLRVTEGGAALDAAAARAAEAIGRRLAAGVPAVGRVTVLAQVAAPPGTEVSVQRRLALDRALAVKRALVAGGVDPTRIDLRPLGRTGEGVDAVDILPPGAARHEAAAGGAQAPGPAGAVAR